MEMTQDYLVVAMMDMQILATTVHQTELLFRDANTQLLRQMAVEHLKPLLCPTTTSAGRTTNYKWYFHLCPSSLQLETVQQSATLVQKQLVNTCGIEQRCCCCCCCWDVTPCSLVEIHEI
jgi:hypothetical protein